MGGDSFSLDGGHLANNDLLMLLIANRDFENRRRPLDNVLNCFAAHKRSSRGSLYPQHRDVAML